MVGRRRRQRGRGAAGRSPGGRAPAHGHDLGRGRRHGRRLRRCRQALATLAAAKLANRPASPRARPPWRPRSRPPSIGWAMPSAPFRPPWRPASRRPPSMTLLCRAHSAGWIPKRRSIRGALAGVHKACGGSVPNHSSERAALRSWCPCPIDTIGVSIDRAFHTSWAEAMAQPGVRDPDAKLLLL